MDILSCLRRQSKIAGAERYRAAPCRYRRSQRLSDGHPALALLRHYTRYDQESELQGIVEYLPD